MSREWKPWFWMQRKGSYCTIRRDRISLGPDREQAFQAFHARMAELVKPVLKPSDSPFVAELVDRFLDHVEKNLAADTYVWYRR